MGFVNTMIRSFLIRRMGGGLFARLLGGPMVWVVLALIRRNGGLRGMLDKFRRAGLVDKADSWLGAGPNQPLDPSEVERALGRDEIRRIARESGMSEEETRARLAAGLPEVMGHLHSRQDLERNGPLRKALDRLERALPG